MQWPAAGVVAIAFLVVASALAGPVAASPGPRVEAAGPATASTHTPTAELCEGGPPDPETDVIGWEAGCWYNQSIAVDQSDGLDEAERNATVARTMARVEHLRQLEFDRTVPVELMSREEYRESQLNNTADPALATFDNVKFEALFLIGNDQDSIEVQNQNAGAAVLGFYSPQREAIVLVSENESALEVQEVTLAHELVHALQDQHFNLSRFDARTRDGANAQSGLIEGDASLVEHRYEQRCADDGAWGGSCLSTPDGPGGGGDLANLGTYLMKFQPYSNGPAFVTSLYRADGWDAVNAAYDDPPVSSSQIIHPAKYPDEGPREVTLSDRHAAPWERVRPPDRPDYASVGEAAVFMMLWYPGYESQRRTEIVPYESFINTSGGEVSSFQPYLYRSRYSTGWDGDRLHVYTNDANETAYVWRLAWETPADAREFVDGYRQLLEYRDGVTVGPDTWAIEDGGFEGAYHIEVAGDTVTIVKAPTTAALTEVRHGIQVTPTPTASPTPASPATGTTPTTASPTAPGTTTDGQPGFGVLAALVAMAAGVLWRRHRS